ncbi:MAG: hypothetical protein WC279_14290 [Sulfurimonas sp.]|uniref:hypothetical protein n=1 Tax=Sulfurimonas sp. TaxID=2022749 RepID=UPI0035692E5C
MRINLKEVCIKEVKKACLENDELIIDGEISLDDICEDDEEWRWEEAGSSGRYPGKMLFVVSHPKGATALYI